MQILNFERMFFESTLSAQKLHSVTICLQESHIISWVKPTGSIPRLHRLNGKPGSYQTVPYKPPDRQSTLLARQAGQFKDLPRSGRPRVTTRAQDRYITNVVTRGWSMTWPKLRRRLYVASGQGACPVSAETVCNRIRACEFKSRVSAKGQNWVSDTAMFVWLSAVSM